MRKDKKLTYEIDPSNRLIFKSAKHPGLPKFRNILDGVYKIDKNNNLIYQVKFSSFSDCPKQIKLKGSWSLDKDHNIVFSLNKDGQFRDSKIIFKSEVIDARSNELGFSVSMKDSKGNYHFYILHISGAWQTDRYNCLTFFVSREKDLHDKLIFNGAWQVNKQNQIVYTYTKTILKRKIKIEREIIFKGFWEIAGRHRIIYVLDKKINSFFEFKVSVAKPARRGLQYEIGIGSRAPFNKEFVIFGSWKINERLGIVFEMPYEQNRIRSIIFGASCKFINNYEAELRLRNDLCEDLGVNLKLSKIFPDNHGQLFMQALKNNKELSVVAGVGFRW
ncbi:MAG: hypothetical protein AB1755_00450 [Candidatus Omnitrophota bacterium]